MYAFAGNERESHVCTFLKQRYQRTRRVRARWYLALMLLRNPCLILERRHHEDLVKKIALKEKAKEFGDSATKAAKTFGSRFQDDDVKAKFREAGLAAQDFGKSITDRFK